jgi:hypothetical protein
MVGMSQELEVPRDSYVPHPGDGGSRGYPLWYRQVCVDVCRANSWTYGAAVLADVEPCQNTLKSWCKEHLVPFEMRGGPEHSSLVGVDLLLMCLYLTAYPAASLDEVVIHIINNGGGVYDHQMISRRMAEIELSKKQGSTEAYQAFMPQNIQRLRRFWTMPQTNTLMLYILFT